MSSSLLNSGQRLKKHSYRWATPIASIVIILLGLGLLTQLPEVSSWISNIMGDALISWLFRVVCVAAVLTITIALIKAFFSYMRDEYDLGPTPLCAFFVFGLIVTLISSF
ncbi:hypothetical protein [Leptothoe spongobia]|uniref:Uncharacterized protein n=1 Tax=Leptothoe spongobia TAU-MAC 1115 TaxID=1967444 RepID=A0A947DI17_9CYAN|nr:hypothetical protein [Leptothoe spongobia]MBT9317356.1 hypothetical protein [Leptothoe spongobia TAU-MAC 1115]